MSIRWAETGISRDHLRIAFRDYFGIKETSASVLVELFEANGSPISALDLRRRISSHRPISPGALHERISHLRAAMECESIDHDKCSYILTEIGLDDCYEALMDAASRLISPQLKIVDRKDDDGAIKPPRRNSRSSCDTLFLFQDNEILGTVFAITKSARKAARA